MKKHIKPVKSKKQTPHPPAQKPPPPAQKVIAKTTHSAQDIDALTARYESLYEQTKYKQAYNISLELAHIYEETLGFMHIKTALMHLNCADIARFVHEYGASTRHYEKVINILKEVPPDADFDLDRINFNTGYCFNLIKNYDKAAYYMTQSIPFFKKKKDYDRFELGSIYILIADAYMSNKKWLPAIGFIRKAVLLHSKQPDKSVELLSSYYKMIGNAYEKISKFKPALTNYQRALNILGTDKKTFSLEKGNMCHTIAFLHTKQEKYLMALDWYEKGLLMYKQKLPENQALLDAALKIFKSIYLPMIRIHGAEKMKPYKQFIKTHFPAFKL